MSDKVELTGFEEIEVLNARINDAAAVIIVDKMSSIDVTDMNAMITASGEAAFEALLKCPDVTAQMRAVLEKHNTLNLPLPGVVEAVDILLRAGDDMRKEGSTGAVWNSWTEEQKSKWAVASLTLSVSKEAMVLYVTKASENLSSIIDEAVKAAGFEEFLEEEERPAVH